MRISNILLTVQLVLVPLIGTSTKASSIKPDNATEVALPMTYLPLATAPKQWLGYDSGKIDVQAGESRSERSARETAAIKEAQKRTVIARSGSVNRAGLSVAEALDLTEKYARQYGVEEAKMTAIITCESKYNQYAKNSRSTASGYGQFLESTWRSTMRAMGRDVNTSPFDAEANLEATAYVLNHQGTTPWNSSRTCWSRF